MPFVNRFDEVFELLQANIGVTLALTKGHDVTDYRAMRVCFGAQMFGSGKTTLGKNFVSALSDHKVMSHIEKRLSEMQDSPEYVERFRREWDLAKQASMLYVDIADARLFGQIPSLVAAAAGVPDSVYNGSAQGFADILLRHTSELGTPLFVHIDEIGNLPADELRALRDSVRRVWLEMNHLALTVQDMPRIYFFLSGKGVSLASLGGSTSPVGTRWIVLDMLHTEHVTAIRHHLESLNNHPLQLKVFTATTFHIFSASSPLHLLNPDFQTNKLLGTLGCCLA